MSRTIPLRLRTTLVCGLLLAACCVLLTLTNSYYAYEMADAIEAVPLQPAQDIGQVNNESDWAQNKAALSLPARQTFRTQSLLAMCIIVVSGCLLVYWLTGKALAPLHQLDEQIRNRTAADLEHPLPVPSSGDEVAGLTRSFNQMSSNLSQAFAQQKRFSQCAAHELRTPLAILKTRMALFRKKGLCSTPETSALLDVLEEQTNRLSDLVGDLLSLTNMDEVDCSESISLHELLGSVTAELAELARSHGIKLCIQEETGTILGNRALLERAVFNLVENAINYNRPEGTVTIRATKKNTQMIIEITDEGPGIPSEWREQIFEPFFRVDKSRSRQLGGAGLGLTLVHAIVDLHHGRIWVEDAPKCGSRFVISLPSALPAGS